MSAGILFNNTVAVTATAAGSANNALISNGAGSAPAFANLTVAGGGTGLATLTTAYGVVCAGTTATGALQNAGAGTAAQVLTSNGAAALPTFQTIAVPNTPSFIAYQSAAVSNATGDGTNYYLICGSTLTNVGAAYATGTGLFTAPTAGTYVFNVNVYLNLLGAAHTLCQCYLNNVTTAVNVGTFAFCNPFAGSNSTQFVVQGNVMLQLAASDQVKVLVQVANGAKTVQIFGAATVLQTAFSGYKIG